MKIAISGKGGTGKTTLTALLGHVFLKEGNKVFLIDADPDGNLGVALGFSRAELSAVKPVSELKDIINQRTENNGSGFFKLNPKVDDIPEKYSLKKDNLHLLILGILKRGGGGCYCPENTFLKALLRNLIIERSEVVIIDMPAGIEHLGRGTAESVDVLLVVVEPTLKSIQTAQRLTSLASDLKMKKILYIGNKITGAPDIKFLEENILGKLAGYVSSSAEILEAEKTGSPVYDAAPAALKEASSIREKLFENQ
ncbi:MAG: hypothetical protein A2297_05600 [Elusimicrobia bacterium RIFOXYB2_FULL_48_7]|nr:MAG: hypothetical protein A2297_05600 [Elusimicrobia bacterium RIFOXYB2_FULL_48_7]